MTPNYIYSTYDATPKYSYAPNNYLSLMHDKDFCDMTVEELREYVTSFIDYLDAPTQNFMLEGVSKSFISSTIKELTTEFDRRVGSDFISIYKSMRDLHYYKIVDDNDDRYMLLSYKNHPEIPLRLILSTYKLINYDISNAKSYSNFVNSIVNIIKTLPEGFINTTLEYENDIINYLLFRSN